MDMTIQQATQNIDNLIATSRLTRAEHVTLQQSLSILVAGAKITNEHRNEGETPEPPGSPGSDEDNG